MTDSLTHVVVRNFRSFQNVDFPLASFTSFVGYNNAGKSNLLMAIRWLIAPFTHRSRIEPLLQGSGVLKIRREMAVPGTAKTAVLFVWDPSSGGAGDWVLSPTGIPESLKVLFPEPVVIGAL